VSILKSELYKLKISKPFYICLFICIAFVALLCLSGNTGAVNMIEQILSLPLLPIICAIFVSLFASYEFQNGTIKNYVSKGFNRTAIYLSKLTACGAAILTMYAAQIVLSYITGTILWGFDPQGVATITNMSTMLAGVGLLLLAYLSVFVFISIWLRSAAASIAVNLCIVFLLPIFLKAISFIIGDGSIQPEDYWISANITALATLTPQSGAVLQGVIVGLCYLTGATIIGNILFKRQDIK
jgi:ABC-2 type transport system permease protein